MNADKPQEGDQLALEEVVDMAGFGVSMVGVGVGVGLWQGLEELDGKGPLGQEKPAGKEAKEQEAQGGT